MLRFLLIGMLLTGAAILADCALYFFFRKRSKISLRAFSAISLITNVYTIGFMLALSLHFIDFQHSRWGFYTLMLFCVPKIIFLLLWLITVLPFIRFRRIRTVNTFICIGVGLIMACAMLHGAFIGWKKLTTSEVTITSANVPPAFDGFRMVQFSDTHLGTYDNDREFIQEVVDRINALQPDIVFFTGDLVNNLSEEVEPYKDILGSIRATHGVYSILGNHDYGDYIQWTDMHDKKKNFEHLIALQEEMNWEMLNDQHTFIYKDNDSIALAGVQNWGLPPFKKYGDLHKATEGLSPDVFTILLSHDPSHWREEILPQTEIDVTLSGHTHAAQLMIGRFSPASFTYTEWGGLYNEGEQFIHVNIGLGSAFIPMRIGAYPDITVIELKRTLQ